MGYITDGELNTPFQFKIKIINDPPYFPVIKSLPDVTVYLNSSIQHLLPVPYDLENQPIRVKSFQENRNRLPPFMTFNALDLTYTISPLN